MYDEMVKALRHCMTKEDGITICAPCPYYGKGIECENVLHTDAAAAIEELQAVLKEADKKQEYQHDCICELTAENEELKDEVMDAQAEVEQKNRDIAVLQKCYQIADEAADKALEPKRGEMYFLEYDNPETGEYEQTYFQCSVCGKYFYGIDECEAKHFNYCPNCGAKMTEVQDGSSR